MTNKNKAKGTKAETNVVKFLEEHGINAKRKALSGRNDAGDIEYSYKKKRYTSVGMLEIKAGEQTYNPSRSQIKEWQRQTAVESNNCCDDITGYVALVVVRHRRSLKDADVYLMQSDIEWLHMYLDEFVDYIKM